MNKERILQVADLIDTSTTFNMCFEANREGDICGTPACVIGHANVLRLQDEGAVAPFLYKELVDYEKARDWLNLSDDRAEAMFYPKYWSRDGAYIAADVANGLRKFAETGAPAALKYPVQDIDLGI